MVYGERIMSWSLDRLRDDPIATPASEGDINHVKAILRVAKREQRQTSKNIGILFTAEIGQEFAVKYFLRAGAHNPRCLSLPASFYAPCTTALHLAVQNRHVKVVRILLNTSRRCTSFPSSQNRDSDSLICTLLQVDDVRIAELLLNSSADMNYQYKCDEWHDRWDFWGPNRSSCLVNEGMMPLLVAAECRSEAIIHFLYARGADPVGHEFCTKETLLHLATKRGHTHAVTTFLEIIGNADINALDINNKRPLLLAVSAGHGATIDILLRNGARGNPDILLEAVRTYCEAPVRFWSYVWRSGEARTNQCSQTLSRSMTFG